jgi:hypothetical protein
VGAIRNRHVETTCECCTSDADDVIRQCVLPDQLEDCNYNHYKISLLCAVCICGIVHKTCFLIKLNHLAPKDDSYCGSVMPR